MNSSSVHGSHVCSKCGWPFPNPHPSAKQRRAHKRVCGRVVVDGFKPHEGNPHLLVSDDEEDHDKGEEIVRDMEKGSGGIGRQVSDRSEEEFSDAVAEFVDVLAVNQSSGGVLDDDVNGAEKGSTANIIKPLESHQNSQTKSSEAMENEIPKSEMLSNPSPSSEPPALVSDVTVQSSNLEVNKEGNIVSSISPIADPLEIALTENTQNSVNGNSLAQIDKNGSMNGKSEEDRGLSTIEYSSISHEINALEDSVQSSILVSTEVGSTVAHLFPMVDPLENATRENIQTSENPNFLTQVDKDADLKGKSDVYGSLSASETSFVCHETTVLEDSLTNDSQTSENLNSSSPFAEDTAMTGKGEHDGGEIFSTAEASVDETKNETSEMDLNLGKAETFVTSDILPLDRITDVADVCDSRSNEVDRSLSTAEASSDGSEIKALAMDIDISKAEEHAKKVPEYDTEGNDVRSITLPIKYILEPEQENSRFEASLGSCSEPAEAGAMQHVGIPVDGAQVEVEPVGIPIEEHSALHVKDCQYQESEECFLSQSLECDEATTVEMVDNSPAHNEAPANISSSVGQIVEDTIPHEGTPNESAVGLVYAEGECHISEANATSEEGLECNVLEALSDPIISDRRILLDPIVADVSPADSEMNEMVYSVEEQESHFYQMDLLSSKTQLQSIPDVSVASDVERSNDDVVNNEADNVTLDDIVHEEERNENSDTTEMRIGKVDAVDDLSTNREFVSEVGSFSQIKPNLEEIMSTHLDAFKHSGGRAGNVHEEENKPESSYDIQDCHGENQLRDVKQSVDLAVNEALAVDTVVPMDITADEPIPVERKSNKDTEVKNSHGGSGNPELEESFASATDSEPNDPSLNVAAGSVISLVEGGTIDVCSRDLAEDSNNLLKQQPEASPILPPEGSIDSISLTDSIEGHWGSISDGNVPSSRYASDSPYIFAAVVHAGNNTQSSKQDSAIKGTNKDQSVEGTDIAETCSANLEEPGRADGKLSSLSETQTAENQSSSVQAGASPSLSDVVYESKGKQKTEEEIIATVVSWSSDKSRTPLRSLLVEANLESKQKNASDQGPRTCQHKKMKVSLQQRRVSPMFPPTKLFLPLRLNYR
ncbi:hypothetical protein Syun_006148 [Stephania yunnanensis]|uniref:Uncharacterized protein n=1 Tax=Stephania yunnanensis TaxID=152371 RepID=A0AAP0KW24_9MAGN